VVIFEAYYIRDNLNRLEGNKIPDDTVAVDPIQGLHVISQIGRLLIANIASPPTIKVLYSFQELFNSVIIWTCVKLNLYF